MGERPTIRCPKCGVGMNHHADKLVHPLNEEEAARVDPALGGILGETHGCPGCGHVEFRRDPSAPQP